MDTKFHNHHPNLYLPAHHMNLKSLHSIDIPPRKQQLLSRRSPLSPSSPMMDSPKLEDAVFSKFLPSNTVDDDDDDDPYSSDHFRMYEFKVRKCNRSRSHDWTDCPFAHPGEKARRRDPRRFHYSGTVCSEFRKGHCGKGDNCEFSHGVFECWLHPSRYRTEACKDGKNCKRKVCFFAHSARQLRIPSEGEEKKNPNLKHCCPCCHSSITASPTSTLMAAAVSNGSPPASPPHISPVASPPYCGGGASMSYKEVILAELMANLEAMNFNRESLILPQAAVPATPRNLNLAWVDVNFKGEEQQPPQFVMSPSTPAGRGHGKMFAGEGEVSGGRNRAEESSGMAGPDLEWVNDLLT